MSRPAEPEPRPTPDGTGAASPESGVRGEHALRVALRDMTERHARMLRAATAAHRYAYGRREPDDLRELRRALSAAGLEAPKRDAPEVDG